MKSAAPGRERGLAADSARVHHDALLPPRENLGQPTPANPIQKRKRGEDVMPNEPDDGARRTVSRRNLFKQAAGAAAALSATTPPLATAQPGPPAPERRRRQRKTCQRRDSRRSKPSPPPKPIRWRQSSRA